MCGLALNFDLKYFNRLSVEMRCKSVDFRDKYLHLILENTES